MSPQTNYGDTRTVGQVGALSDVGANEVVSKFAAAAIPFGRFVTKDGTTTDKVKLPVATGEITGQGTIQGVAIRTQAVQVDPAATVAQYAAGDAVNVLKSGRCLMLAEQTVTPADPVFVRFTANGAGKDLGQVRKDADTARAVQFNRARYITGATAGSLVEVEFSIP